MSDWPDWFQEALRQRFYQLELVSEQQASNLSEDEHLLTQMDQFKTNQNEDIQRLLSEWEEAIGYQLSQDKQSIYMEGVKDGIGLILPVVQPTVTR
jgi:thiol:disulfide interchange protein